MTPTQTPPRDNLIGSLFMIGAMAAFAVEDSFVKAAALTLPVGQILILFGLGGALCFALSARASGAALFPRAALSRVMQIRSLFEITGRLFYVLAIALTPLSSATVILQATPLLVVAGAALVFGEQVGWRRWSAIVIGLIGVIVIVQPGSDSFSALSIFAIIGMIGFAGRDLASRAAPKSLGTAIPVGGQAVPVAHTCCVPLACGGHPCGCRCLCNADARDARGRCLCRDALSLHASVVRDRTGRFCVWRNTDDRHLCRCRSDCGVGRLYHVARQKDHRPLNKPPRIPRTMRRPVVPVSSFTTILVI